MTHDGVESSLVLGLIIVCESRQKKPRPQDRSSRCSRLIDYIVDVVVERTPVSDVDRQCYRILEQF